MCECRAISTGEYTVVVFYTSRIILHMRSLCYEDERSFATESGKPLICPPKASIISISQASPPSPRVFRYRSNLKYFPLKAASLAEQLMLALLQQPYGTPKSNYFNNTVNTHTYPSPLCPISNCSPFEQK